MIPAAGAGRRIAPLPCSKELYPIGFERDGRTGEPRAKVVSAYLLDKFRAAGVRKALIVLRAGKWDIPAYFTDGSGTGVSLAYVVVGGSIGPPDTVDKAYAFIANRPVAFGFPDVLCGPDDLFVQLHRRQGRSGADLVLGLFPAPDCRLADMVASDGDGRIRDILLKPESSDLRYTWVCAVWTPTFTEFMHAFLACERRQASTRTYEKIDPGGDLPVGAVIKAALAHGLRIDGVPFPDETYTDIGTPGNLMAASRDHSRV